MTNQTKLTLVKILHTLIWIFFNIVILYMIYAVLNDKLDIWFWLGYVSFAVEAGILFIFGMQCPLTILAKKYTNNHRIGFDIYLPTWLAEYNKLIYSIILGLVFVTTVYQLLKPG
jgi:hypothetical protein